MKTTLRNLVEALTGLMAGGVSSEAIIELKIGETRSSDLFAIYLDGERLQNLVISSRPAQSSATAQPGDTSPQPVGESDSGKPQ